MSDYIVSVARRPRDIIAFFNTCILSAVDLDKIGAKELRIAEGDYSRLRLRALADEWNADYPTLLEFAGLLERRPTSFKIGSVDLVAVEARCLDICVMDPGANDLLVKQAMRVVEGHTPSGEFRILLFRILYRVGLVGLKLRAFEAESWADEHGAAISAAEITEETSVIVHPTYRRALGILEDA